VWVADGQDGAEMRDAPARTFVLVHGGCYTSTCWERVVPHLRGHVVLVDLPGRGSRPADLTKVRLSDNVAATINDIDSGSSDGDEIILVGHSMAGSTLAHVANKIGERIARVVMISCAINGTSEVDHTEWDLRESVMGNISGGIFRLDEATATAVLCSDLDEEQTSCALDGMVDEASSMLTETVDLTGLRGRLPVTYVRLLEDRCVPVEQQERVISAIGDVQVIDLESGHMAMISHPAEIAAILNDVSGRSGGQQSRDLHRT
jgi:pimeloyl-ACP methyl ester carboxylesterase